MGSEDESLYQYIRSSMKRKILSGQWPADSRIPRERELQAEYGRERDGPPARMTINRAVSGLVEAGLIERRGRAGNFVSRPRAVSAVLEIQDIPVEITSRDLAYRFEIPHLKIRQATRQECKELKIKGAKVMSITCVHFAGPSLSPNGLTRDEEPYVLEERLINLGAVREAEGVDFTLEPPGSWLLHNVPWVEAEHWISAEAADGRIAQWLKIEPWSPCLVIERQTWRTWQSSGKKQTVTKVRLTYPGAAQRLVARFRHTS